MHDFTIHIIISIFIWLKNKLPIYKTVAHVPNGESAWSPRVKKVDNFFKNQRFTRRVSVQKDKMRWSRYSCLKWVPPFGKICFYAVTTIISLSLVMLIPLWSQSYGLQWSNLIQRSIFAWPSQVHEPRETLEAGFLRNFATSGLHEPQSQSAWTHAFLLIKYY